MIEKREIKFKGFDFKEKVYWNEEEVAEYGIGNLYEDKNFHLLQFTGMQDLNFREIYEGDIVKTWEGELMCILFKYGSWVAKNGGKEYELSKVDEDVEVFGNIYTDKDLLKNINP